MEEIHIDLRAALAAAIKNQQVIAGLMGVQTGIMNGEAVDTLVAGMSDEQVTKMLKAEINFAKAMTGQHPC